MQHGHKLKWESEQEEEFVYQEDGETLALLERSQNSSWRMEQAHFLWLAAEEEEEEEEEEEDEEEEEEELKEKETDADTLASADGGIRLPSGRSQ